MREVLLGVQVALSVVLVSAAALFLVTLRNLTSLDAGFQSSGVLVANVFLNDRSYPPETRAGVQRELTARLTGIPGIQGVAHSTTPPLSGSAWDTVVNVKTARGETRAESNRSLVSSGYFAVMQTPLITGRDFSDRDTPTSPKVAVVNETFARNILGDPRPLGRTFVDGADAFEVVGVVGNTKQYAIREDFRPIAYTAASQVAQPGLTIRFVLRTGIGMAATIDSVRRAVGEFDSAASVRFATLDELATDSLQRERLMANLSGFFGAIAIVLAAVGVYGVVAYTASTRRRDIGIRLALGASGAHVIRIVLGTHRRRGRRRVAPGSRAGAARDGRSAVAPLRRRCGRAVVHGADRRRSRRLGPRGGGASDTSCAAHGSRERAQGRVSTASCLCWCTAMRRPRAGLKVCSRGAR